MTAAEARIAEMVDRGGLSFSAIDEVVQSIDHEPPVDPEDEAAREKLAAAIKRTVPPGIAHEVFEAARAVTLADALEIMFAQSQAMLAHIDLKIRDLKFPKRQKITLRDGSTKWRTPPPPERSEFQRRLAALVKRRTEAERGARQVALALFRVRPGKRSRKIWMFMPGEGDEGEMSRAEIEALEDGAVMGIEAKRLAVKHGVVNEHEDGMDEY